MTRPRVVVGISGASGAALGVRVVELLAAGGRCEVHLVVTRSAERTLAHEVGPDALKTISTLATRGHPIADVGASIASGAIDLLGDGLGTATPEWQG